MASRLVLSCALAFLLPSGVLAQEQSSTPSTGRLKVYLDCNNCYGNFIREEVDMVEYP
jgi:hypothetical protein